jgi:hypothetical protein
MRVLTARVNDIRDQDSDLVLRVWIKEMSEWKSHKNPKTAVGTGINPIPYTGDGKISGIS